MPCAALKRFFVLFCLTGCFLAVHPAMPAFAAQEIPVITLKTSSPEYAWSLQTPGKSGVVQVLLSLRDAAGKPVAGKQVTGEVWMPGMPMPGYPLELDFYEEAPGNYAALVQYAHGGLWQIKARFKGEGGRVFEEVFDFTLQD